MDIDSPPSRGGYDPHAGHKHLDLPVFSASFPLPFRVLFLVGLAILLWAVNIHVLHLLGLDTSWILEYREEPADDDPLAGAIPLEHVEADMLEANGSSRPGHDDSAVRIGRMKKRPESSKLYGPVYRLWAMYTAYVGSGWVLFRLITGGEADAMERWRFFVGILSLGAIGAVLLPWRGVGEREREAMRQAIKRILLPKLSDPIYFSDVILADILTSFAKVLGDMWISTCQIWGGGITQGRVAQTGWSNYLTLAMVCLPYVIRLRQCLHEYYQTSATRSLLNALKYFSAFPVIFFSAAQKALFYEIAKSQGISLVELGDGTGPDPSSGTRWFGEHRVFRLWLLAVVINSMYSFYWDIEMDWGLSLCKLDTWFGPRLERERERERRGGSPGLLTRVRSVLSRGAQSTGLGHSRSPAPGPLHVDGPISRTVSLSSLDKAAPSPSMSPMSPSRPWTAFGLRQILLLPDPLVYHLFALIDLVLRFTWSLKLSSHLHTISEIESGVFMMEALELVRRWMWVFIRVEWEAVKKGEQARLANSRGEVVWDGSEGR